MSRFGSAIHAFLPSIGKIEFGAVTPKMNHLTVNIAGAEINAESMNQFLRYPPVRLILPPGFDSENSELAYFKGRFPLQVSRGFFGDRYVVVGDAAGILRPFKGKGVNMGIISAMRAAKTIMTRGVSRQSFQAGYVRECREVLEDLPYGKMLRWLAIRSSRMRFLDPIIELAKDDVSMAEALFDCVSAHKSFKQIFYDTVNAALALKIIKTLFLFLVRSIIRPHSPASEPAEHR